MGRKLSEHEASRRNLRGEIIAFVAKYKTAGYLKPEEATAMENLYNRWYFTSERIQGCDLCAIRLWTKLCKIAATNDDEIILK